MNINNVFSQFCQDLINRQGFLSEDNIRFYWFTAMLKQDSNLNNYSLEEPYPDPLQRKELDLKYETEDEILCFEIKFHRHPNNGPKNAFTHPQSAGEVFNDIIRLPFWQNDSQKPIRRFLLYVTDEEMHKYLSRVNQINYYYRLELQKFYCHNTSAVSPCPICLNFPNQVPISFKEYALKGLQFTNLPQNINITLCHTNNFSCNSTSIQGNHCHVRLYEIVVTDVI